MNIVIVTPFFNERLNNIKSKTKSSLTILAEELSKYANISIISSKIPGEKKIEEINPNLRIIRFKPTFFIPSLPYVLDILQFLKIIRICKKHGCNVLIGNSLQFFCCFSAAIASKIGNYPFICRIIGESSTTNRFLIDFIAKLYDHSFSKLILKIADKIFVQSKIMLKRPISLGIPSKKVVIVEDGVDLSKYDKNVKPNYLREEFNIAENNIVITFTSRLYKLKGIEDLIIVAKDIVNDYSNVIFLIAGTGPLYNKLVKETKDKDQIKILGYRKDVPNILALSNIHVHPSYSEGLSPSILEACAMGLPIVSTPVGSNPDLFANGIKGFLIEPGDIDNLKKSLIKLIEDKELRNEMGKNNERIIQEKYDLKKTALKFLEQLNISN